MIQGRGDCTARQITRWPEDRELVLAAGKRGHVRAYGRDFGFFKGGCD